jgi:hypothetical protein
MGNEVTDLHVFGFRTRAYGPDFQGLAVRTVTGSLCHVT